MKNLRTLAILLLDDENGINSEAYFLLEPMLHETGNQDILDVVECQHGRYYLGEDDAQDLLAAGKVTVETPLGE